MRLPDGRQFAGYAEVCGGIVYMPMGRLRVRDTNGERLYAPRARSWPVRRVAAIDWASTEALA